MSPKQALLVALALLVVVSMTTALTIAQSPAESGVQAVAPGAEPAAPDGANAVGNYIPVQGRLTAANGVPLSGTFTITFRLYSAVSGGVALCSDAKSVSVNNGLFSSEIGGNCQDQMNGQQLYLGIEVGSDGEMMPRQPIYAVPYAWSLRPGAVISSSIGPGAILHLENWDPAGRGLHAYAMGTAGATFGVIGASRSPAGYGGYFYNNGGGTGLRAESNTGAALSATGSGIIKSTADTTISVSALKALADVVSVGDVQFLSNMGIMTIRPVVSGTHHINIPVDLPSVLFGTPTKLKSVRVCYQCSDVDSFVDVMSVILLPDSGISSSLITDGTHRTSTIWGCYTVTDAYPNLIQGSLVIQLRLSFAGPGPGMEHDIRIGNIALTLTEQ
jgi:hypothetical protein